jgi:hypothetical protein
VDLVKRLAYLTVLAWALAPLSAPAQVEPGRLTGRITDESGGALPGVIVAATSSGVATSVSVVTDAVGHYALQLPAGTYAVTFSLPGFQAEPSGAIALRAGEVLVLDRQLGLAPLTETVTVVAPVPPPPPAPPPMPAPPAPPPKPRSPLVPIPSSSLASVCGPSQLAGDPGVVGRIVRHRYDVNRQLYGRGDVLVLDIGADHGIAVGRNFVVRRRFRVGDRTLPLKDATWGEHTAGVLQVIEAGEASSIAEVVYACDEFMAGDRLEPFDAAQQVADAARGTPMFDDPARIVFGTDGRLLGAPPQLLVIDHGASRGVVRGQRLTVFRRPSGYQTTVSTIAEGTVISVRPDGATIRLDRATDAVAIGDLVALHR